MKTLLSIGVLVAVISWTSGKNLTCWRYKLSEADKEKYVLNGYPIPEVFNNYCQFDGKTIDEAICEKGNCTKDAVCFRRTYSYRGEVKVTRLGCALEGAAENVEPKSLECFGVGDKTGCGVVKDEADSKCAESPLPAALMVGDDTVIRLGKPDGIEKTCVCYKDLCNVPTPTPTPTPTSELQNGANKTSYTHLIIAFIVGAMFLH